VKIIAGTFGVKGSAFLSGGKLHIESSKKAAYRPSDIESLDIDQITDKGFSVGRALVGAALLGLLLMLVAGVLGLMAGLLIGALGGFAAEKHTAAAMSFSDGNKVRVLCTSRAVNKLVGFKG